uniref:Uncharacterized protein n=1 Tax=Sinocyclocheilus anshuiensis TaxID=1608454 RepID=A0A671LF72_9TELE
MLRRPGSSWRFGALIKGTSVVVLKVEKSAVHSLPPPTIPAGPETQTRNLWAVEKQIRDLVEKQAQLRERRAALETSQADAHKSGVTIQRAANSPTTATSCVSLERPGAPSTRSSQMSFTPAPRATTSPPPTPPVFEISTQNCFAPLRETECDTVIVGDSIVRHVCAMLAEGKVHTHCFPGARVLDVSAQIPAILKGNFYFDFPSLLLTYSLLALPAWLPLISLTLLILYSHTLPLFYSLLLALMADLCLPLSAARAVGRGEADP